MGIGNLMETLETVICRRQETDFVSRTTRKDKGQGKKNREIEVGVEFCCLQLCVISPFLYLCPYTYLNSQKN